MKLVTLLALCAATVAALPHQAVLKTLEPTNTYGAQQRFLIQLSPEETRWVTEEEKWTLKRKGQRFMDITSNQDLGVLRNKLAKTVTFPSSVAYNRTVKPMLGKLDKARMRTDLEKFSSYHTRYYQSDYGRQSSEWLLGRIKSTLAPAKGASAAPFKHTWVQSSNIATIPGKSNKTIVIGAHQDSVNMFLPTIMAAPGADDDGSGTVTILEALRVLLSDPKIAAGEAENTIEFQWYSAEEGGLLGSQAIFTAYEKQGRDVKAMLQQDMTGYTAGTTKAGKREAVGVITDFVDAGLTNFIKTVITAYCDIPYVETKCGYACSDHASASKAGYPSAFVIESAMEDTHPDIHTGSDTIDKLNFDHMLQHAKMTLGLAYELAFAKF